jgi:hypothetical protein
MESALFEIDLLTGPELGIPGGETPPLYGRRDARCYGGARTSRFAIRHSPFAVHAWVRARG